ncbi:hypothetical protein NUACC21_15720 [Scytonema sp. NUACC21]
MDSQIEKLLKRQIDLVERLQERADEVLDWRTSPDNAETVLQYFEALECAVESLESLSEVYQESKDWELKEDNNPKRDRTRDDRDDYRITERERDEYYTSDRVRDDRDDYDNRRR